MITLKSNLLRGVALSFAVLALASLANAQEERFARRAPEHRRAPSFDVSGSFTGATGGQLVIDGIGYSYGDKLQVYQLGVGLVPIDQVAIGSYVFASGPGSADSGTVLVMIARPANEDVVDSTYPSPNIRVVDPSSPR
jgi:hypothetical protein